MEENTFSRKATMEDFLDGETINQDQSQSQNNKHNKNYSNNNDNVQKNQQEFGHKKRIKP